MYSQFVTPIPKPKHKRGKKKMSELGKVTPEVYDEIVERSGGVCECCGRLLDGDRRSRMEAAHLIRRSQGGRGDQPWQVGFLCGPAVNTGTCHNWVDYTSEGREWAKEYSFELQGRYNEGDWPE